MRKILMMICAAVLIAGCGDEQPAAVTTEKALPADSELTSTPEEPIPVSNGVKVFSPISGNVLEKYFEDGSDVTEGQKLFKVGSQQDSLELSQRKTELAESMTALARAMSELAQAEKNSSAQELADKKFAVEDLQADIAELQRRVEEMENDAAQGIIYAPISGRIGANVLPIGMSVVANETILTTIENADSGTQKNNER